MRTQFRRRGVSLIDLSISLSIGGILAAVACTAAGSMRNGVRQMVCMSHLRQIGRAVATYQSDWGDVDTVSDAAAQGICLPPQTRLHEVMDLYGAPEPVRRCSERTAAPTAWMDYSWLPQGAELPALTNEAFLLQVQRLGGRAVLAADFRHREPPGRTGVPRTRSLLLHLNRSVTTLLQDGIGALPPKITD